MNTDNPAQPAGKSGVGGLRDSATVWWWLSLIARSAGLLVVMPLALRAFAPETVTLWLAFSSIVVVLATFDLGLNTTFTRLIAYADPARQTANPGMRAAPGTGPTFEALVGTIGYAFVALALTVLATGAIAGTWYLAPIVGATSDPLDGWLAWAIVVICSSVLIGGAGFAVVLNGLQQMAAVKRWEALAYLASAVTGTLLLLGGVRSLALLVLCTQGWSVLYIVILACRTKRQLPAGLGIHLRVHRDVMTRSWPAAWRTQVGTLAGLGMLHATGLVYARIATPGEAAPFLLALQLMFALEQFAVPPFYARLPALASHYANGESRMLERSAAGGMALACWTFVLGAMAGGLVIPELLELAGSRTAFVGIGLWSALSLAFYSERVASMHLQMCAVTHRINWHVANLATAAIFAVAMVCLIPVSRDYAIPLSMLVAYGLFQVSFSIAQMGRYLGIPLWRFERRTILAPFVLLLCYVAAAVGMAGA